MTRTRATSIPSAEVPLINPATIMRSHGQAAIGREADFLSEGPVLLTQSVDGLLIRYRRHLTLEFRRTLFEPADTRGCGLYKLAEASIAFGLVKNRVPGAFDRFFVLADQEAVSPGTDTGDRGV